MTIAVSVAASAIKNSNRPNNHLLLLLGVNSSKFGLPCRLKILNFPSKR
jgi:hypothetical protein